MITPELAGPQRTPRTPLKILSISDDELINICAKETYLDGRSPQDIDLSEPGTQPTFAQKFATPSTTLIPVTEPPALKGLMILAYDPTKNETLPSLFQELSTPSPPRRSSSNSNPSSATSDNYHSLSSTANQLNQDNSSSPSTIKPTDEPAPYPTKNEPDK